MVNTIKIQYRVQYTYPVLEIMECDSSAILLQGDSAFSYKKISGVQIVRYSNAIGITIRDILLKSKGFHLKSGKFYQVNFFYFILRKSYTRI